MEYKITGGNLPVVRCKLEQGESIYCEAGAMSWMDDTLTMDTSIGGAKTLFSKALTNSAVFADKNLL